MSEIRIKVGASVDRSVASAFAQVGEAAKRARKVIENEARAGTNAEKAAAREIAAAARDAERDRVSAARAAAKDRAAVGREEVREVERQARERARVQVKIEKDMQRDLKRERDRVDRNWMRASTEANKERNKISQGRAELRSNVSGHIVGGVSSAFGMARGIASDMARGMGVDLSLGSLFSKNVDLETRASQLSNSGYMPGKDGPNGQRQDKNAIMEQAFDVGTQTGTEANTVVEGLQAFVAKTGDLKTGRDLMMQLARLAKATGSSMADMADAAGDVYNNLGDIPDKAGAVDDVMKSIAAQGKEGAVEIKDLANQMAKVASAASQFEGNRQQNMAMFGAFTQYTRAKGGSASPTQAATSVMSFMGAFGKGKTLDALKGLGIRTEGAGGQTRDPEEIILETLRAVHSKKTKKGGSELRMGDVFADTRARAVVRPFENKFNETYTNTIGEGKDKEAQELDRVNKAIEATRAEFDQLKNSTMQETELRDSLAVAMATQESQATSFNNQMQQTTMELQTALLPALQTLGPVLIDFSRDLASLLPNHKNNYSPNTAFKAGLVANADISEIQSSGGIMGLNGGDPEAIEKHRKDAAVLAHQLDLEKADRATKAKAGPGLFGDSDQFDRDIAAEDKDIASNQKTLDDLNLLNRNQLTQLEQINMKLSSIDFTPSAPKAPPVIATALPAPGVQE